MNNIFSPVRTAKLIRKDLYGEWTSFAVWGGAMVAIVIISILVPLGLSYIGNGFSSLSQYGRGFHKLYITLFCGFLFLGGFLISSSMFKDLHDKSRNIYWLTLPGSNLEKMVSRIVISSFIYALVLIIVYPLVIALASLLSLIFFGQVTPLLSIFDPQIWNFLPYYFVLQSVFFAGGAFFRKHPFAKTLLSMFVLLLVASMIFLVLVRFSFPPWMGAGEGIGISSDMFQYFIGVRIGKWMNLLNFIVSFGKILFWGVLAPFFYLLSYFKLSEKEVRDGV